MSAYIVEREHIVYLVQAAMHRALYPCQNGPALSWIWDIDHEAGAYKRETFHEPGDSVRVGNMLWDENRESVSYRYQDGENLPGPIGENYTITAKDFHIPLAHVDPVQVLKACDCYEYQACEHRGWEDSEAHAFIQALRERAYQALPGYDEAEWGAPKPLKSVCNTRN